MYRVSKHYSLEEEGLVNALQCPCFASLECSKVRKPFIKCFTMHYFTELIQNPMLQEVSFV